MVTREIAVTAVLSAAYAAAILLVVIPSPTGGYTHVGDLDTLVMEPGLATSWSVADDDKTWTANLLMKFRIVTNETYCL